MYSSYIITIVLCKTIDLPSRPFFLNSKTETWISFNMLYRKRALESSYFFFLGVCAISKKLSDWFLSAPAKYLSHSTESTCMWFFLKIL